eukprot:1453359-Pyramimonas_sp.AAC.1
MVPDASDGRRVNTDTAVGAPTRRGGDTEVPRLDHRRPWPPPRGEGKTRFARDGEARAGGN